MLIANANHQNFEHYAPVVEAAVALAHKQELAEGQSYSLGVFDLSKAEVKTAPSIDAKPKGPDGFNP